MAEQFSTDKILTNPDSLVKTPRVILSGSIDLSTFIGVTGGYATSGSEELYYGEKGDIPLGTFEVYHYIFQGSGVEEYRKGDYTYADGVGTKSRSLKSTITSTLVTGNTYQVLLNIEYFTSDSGAGVRDGSAWTQTFYYKVYSTPITS